MKNYLLTSCLCFGFTLFILPSDTVINKAHADIAKTSVAAMTQSNNTSVSLPEAVMGGLATNPTYQAIIQNQLATAQEKRQALGLYFPSVDAVGDVGVEHSDDPGTRGGVDDDPEDLARYDAGVTVTQLLFDGGDAYYENQRQKQRTNSASHRVKETAEFLALEMTESYLDVLEQRELLRISRKNVRQHQSILQQIQDSAEAGRTTEADLRQIEARLTSANAQMINIQEALSQAEAAYGEVIGHMPGLLSRPSLPYAAVEDSLDEAVRITLHQSPTMHIVEADVLVANAEYKGANSAFYPQLDLELNAREGRDIGGVRGRDTSASALVTMDWNLYNGGADVARVRELTYREAAAKETLAEAGRQVERDVRETWARMVAARERAEQFREKVKSDQIVVDAYKDQFDLSRRTLLDVLDSQNELFVSQSNQINAEFLELAAVYRLVALKGELLPVLSVPYVQEAKTPY